MLVPGVIVHRTEHQTSANDDLELARFRERLRIWSLRDFVRRERLGVVVLGGSGILVVVCVFLCVVTLAIDLAFCTR
jgi:hypothetical protein